MTDHATQIGDAKWLTDVDGREPFAATAAAALRSHQQELANALGIAQRTSGDLITDLHHAQREAQHPSIGASTRAELDAMIAALATINRTLTRLREQAV